MKNINLEQLMNEYDLYYDREKIIEHVPVRFNGNTIEDYILKKDKATFDYSVMVERYSVHKDGDFLRSFDTIEQAIEFMVSK